MKTKSKIAKISKMKKWHYLLAGIFLLMFIFPAIVSAQAEPKLGVEHGDFFDYRLSDSRFSGNSEVRVMILNVEELSYSSEVKYRIAGTDYSGAQGSATYTDSVGATSDYDDRIVIVRIATELLSRKGGFFIPLAEAPGALRVLSVEDDVDITMNYNSDGVLTSSTMKHDGSTIKYTLTDKGHRDGTPFSWFLQDYWYVFAGAGLVMVISVSIKVIRGQKNKIKISSAHDYNYWIPFLEEEIERISGRFQNNEAIVSHLADFIYAKDQRANGVMSRIQARKYATVFLQSQTIGS